MLDYIQPMLPNKRLTDAVKEQGNHDLFYTCTLKYIAALFKLIGIV